MFENVIKCLLRGDFICNVSDPASFEFLQSEENRDDMSAFLGRMNYTLEATAAGDAWFLGSGRMGDRSEIKQYFSKIKLQIRPIVSFLRIIMIATGNDQVLSAGDKLRFDQLLNAIGDNQNLQDQLKALSISSKDLTTSDPTHKAKLSRLCSYMCNNGYFVEEDSTQLHYRVTGKISHFHEIVEFLVENEITEVAEEAAPTTGALF